ncbi:PREDICTED: transmembrane protein 140 [Gekko japonicus]|uniref:Transmembrane protein 140 n=1 Tax=Gekko japonicus TaxID=146911 RepID=A0ABM1KSW1_GEKJA|nr:PREDICTED: transmembrane protein 140 [Gekko japonicus]XP_015276798.1 PREDICTED: transmembrane protein 140 [Gekko japonicus]
MKKQMRAITNSNIGLGWKRYCRYLIYLSNLFLVTGYIALLFYALIWEAGIIVSLPTKRIGFYNICLWNEEAEELDCLLIKDLEKMGINKVALVLSRICVYSTPVLCLYVATTILQALCLKDKDGWKLACILLAVGALSLPAGLSLFLFQTERWVQISELGGVFVALAGAHALLLLHMITIATYLAQLKDARPPGQFFPVKSIP